MCASLSRQLLLRNYPHTFAFISISPMNLSSRNRSNSKALRLILPCVAPVCEGMHYHKTGMPWQMKSTLIIVFFPFKMLSDAKFCKDLQGFQRFSIFIENVVHSAKCSKSEQNTVVNRSKTHEFVLLDLSASFFRFLDASIIDRVSEISPHRSFSFFRITFVSENPISFIK